MTYIIMLYSVYNEFVNLSIAFFTILKLFYIVEFSIFYYMPKIKPKPQLSTLCQYIKIQKSLNKSFTPAN